jgi:hypothetical protein
MLFETAVPISDARCEFEPAVLSVLFPLFGSFSVGPNVMSNS